MTEHLQWLSIFILFISVIVIMTSLNEFGKSLKLLMEIELKKKRRILNYFKSSPSTKDALIEAIKDLDGKEARNRDGV